jgi:hypothetical protein
VHAVKSGPPSRPRAERGGVGGGGGEPDPEIVDTAAKFVQVNEHLLIIGAADISGNLCR